MPVYEYACEKCRHEFEVEQRISEDPIKTCPQCRARKVKRLISRTSFVLKGSGWYSDLYSSSKGDAKSESKPDGGAADTSAKSDAKSESKSESAPAAKPEKKSKGKASSKAA